MPDDLDELTPCLDCEHLICVDRDGHGVCTIHCGLPVPPCQFSEKVHGNVVVFDPEGPEALDATYTEPWFRKRFRYRSPYHRFTEAILEVFEPESVADVGCGMAWTVEFLRTRLPCIGVEGTRTALALMKPEVRRLVHLADLARDRPLPQMADYELVVSFEVAEHIPEEHSERFLDWCTQGERLLLTAAPPHQGGNHYVNCQEPEWWVRRLERRGWSHDADLTIRWRKAVRQRTRGCPWVVRNALVFQKEGGAPP